MSWNGNKTRKLVRAAGSGVDNRPGGPAPLGLDGKPDFRGREILGLLVLRSRNEHHSLLALDGTAGIDCDAHTAAKGMEKDCTNVPAHSRLDTCCDSPDSQSCRAF